MKALTKSIAVLTVTVTLAVSSMGFSRRPVETLDAAGTKAAVTALTTKILESSQFAFSELLARIRALVRRATQTAEPTTLSYADLTVDLLTRQVTRGERKIELQAREFSLLEYLLRNAGRVMSKTMILEHVQDFAFDPKTNVIDVLVSRLRSKIDRDFDRKLIHTMRGFGYVLKSDEA